jgi:H+/Cl- antiporter ClcA
MTEEHTPGASRPLLFLAGTSGLLGFLLCARLLLEGDGMRIHLPAYALSFDGTDMLQAIVPAILGGLAGLAFVAALPLAKALLARVGGVVPQTIVGTLVFASLAAAFPILRFSGHHEMEALLEWGQGAGMAALLVLGLLKALALAVCLASGWRGGAAFPLLFAGASAGGAALYVMPGMAPTLALIAGMTAAITAGMGKPTAAVLITAFLVSPFAPGPLLVGALVGYGYSRIGPKAELH